MLAALHPISTRFPESDSVPQERRERVVPATFTTYTDDIRNIINEVLAVFLDR